MDIEGTFKNLKFLLKLINLILVLICLIMWVIRRDKYLEDSGFYGHDNGMDPRKFSQIALFAFTIPAYVIILLVLVIAFLLGEEPDKWTSRLVLVTGAVLFCATGIVSFINYFNGLCLDTYGKMAVCDEDYFGTSAIINAIVCVVVCVLMIVDILKTENVF